MARLRAVRRASCLLPSANSALLITRVAIAVHDREEFCLYRGPHQLACFRVGEVRVGVRFRGPRAVSLPTLMVITTHTHRVSAAEAFQPLRTL